LETVIFMMCVVMLRKKDLFSQFNTRLGIFGRHLPLKTAAPEKQGSPHHWKFSKVLISQ
jgi:hypothetical protein